MTREQIAYDRGYRVTKDGDLLNPKGKKIGSISTKGYEGTGIWIDKKQQKLHTHRLQAYQKYGNKLFEDGIVVRHLNGNPLDNSFNNIAIGTYRDNVMDIPKEIRTKSCVAAAKTLIKYPKEFVLKLREEHKEMKSYSELSKKHNMPRSMVWQLINKRKVFKDA